METDLKIEPIQFESHMEDINRIDREILDHSREHQHKWVAATRDGFGYKRDSKIVGYGYVGSSTGPFAVLDENDYPAVLAHVESFMAARGEDFGAEAPLINQKAIQYFIEHKYQIDSFSAIFMSNEPFG
jgi:hypothetical protein